MMEVHEILLVLVLAMICTVASIISPIIGLTLFGAIALYAGLHYLIL